MIQEKYHTVIDEYSYDRQELVDLYYRELEPLVIQYGAKMRWGPEKRQAWTPGINAVDPTLKPGCEWLTDFPELDRIFKKFNIKDFHPNDMDVLVYNQEYEFPPHVDFKQNCVIMLPILPDDGGQPIDYYHIPGQDLEKYTKFRDLDKERYLEYTYKYSTQHPTLSNGMVIHGVDKLPPDQTRVYLRIKILKETYADVVSKLEKGVFIND